MRILPWFLCVVQFVIIIFLFVKWVSKEPDSTPPPSVGTVGTSTSSSASPEPSPSRESQFQIGDSVSLSINTNLRDKPGGDLIQTLTKEETLELTDGPTAQKESWWWKAKVASTSAQKSDQLLGLTGYIAEGYWMKKK